MLVLHCMNYYDETLENINKLVKYEEYSEAKRLSCFLKYFKPIENENIIPNNSLLREFIGGSVFDY